MLIPTTFWDSLPSVCWSAMPLSFQTSHQRASTSRSATHMTIQPRPLTAKETRSAMYSVPIHPGRWSVRERERREREGGRERVRERERWFLCNCSLERLILKCGLKGPSWLHIKQPSTFDHMTVMWFYLFISIIFILVHSMPPAAHQLVQVWSGRPINEQYFSCCRATSSPAPGCYELIGQDHLEPQNWNKRGNKNNFFKRCTKLSYCYGQWDTSAIHIGYVASLGLYQYTYMYLICICIISYFYAMHSFT